jgi:N-acetylmuramoyl-L-alanine amidase
MNKRIFQLILILSGIILQYSVNCSAENPGSTVRVVVIDAGHGGEDPGALGKSTREKDIVLEIALKAGSYIEENFPDVKVIYTRDKDVFIPLYERADIANKAKADLFISIHANWAQSYKISGAETYALGAHKSEQNLEVVMKENSVITLEDDYTLNYEGFDPNSSESYIIFSLMQNIHLGQSLTFASYVQNQFRDRAMRTDRGVKQDIFLVLWRTTMPSVLIETGFITNPAEEKYLISEGGQSYLASAIFRAFKEYKTDVESKSLFTTVKPEPETGQFPGTTADNVPEDKTVFMVQIASYGDKISESDTLYNEFKNLTVILKDNSYKYLSGFYYTYQEAIDYSKALSDRYPGAFVVAVRNNKIIPLKEALED